jgi:hypothetical protein
LVVKDKELEMCERCVFSLDREEESKEEAL